MTITAIVGEDHQLILSEEQSRKLVPGTKVRIEIDRPRKDDRVNDAPDRAQFDAVVAKWAGVMRNRLEEDGYTSVDEFMDDIRPRE